jgi:hypothetical protein
MNTEPPEGSKCLTEIDHFSPTMKYRHEGAACDLAGFREDSPIGAMISSLQFQANTLEQAVTALARAISPLFPDTTFHSSDGKRVFEKDRFAQYSSSTSQALDHVQARLDRVLWLLNSMIEELEL